jgi:DNA polymerase-3 subunit beta
MKLRIPRADLLKALTHVRAVVDKARTTIPILSNILLEAGGGKLVLTGTDMEITVRESVPAAIGRAGSTTASANTLYEIVRKLPDGVDVDLDHAGGDANLKLSAGRYSTTLVVLPIEDFPATLAVNLPKTFSMPTATMKRLLDRTGFAMSNEETRYYLNGIYLHVAKVDDTPLLRAVATNGHMLARADEPLPEGAGEMPAIIVPRKTVNEASRLLDGAGDTITVSASDNRIQFEIGRITLLSKLIDGTFPEYERVIPVENDKTMRVTRKDFVDAVGRVSVISAERSRPVKLSLAKGMLVISAASPEMGTATEELDGEQIGYDGAPIEIGFQARYLNDVAGAISGDLQFRLKDESSPTIIESPADTSALYIIMPMRV